MPPAHYKQNDLATEFSFRFVSKNGLKAKYAALSERESLVLRATASNPIIALRVSGNISPQFSRTCRLPSDSLSFSMEMSPLFS